MVAVSVVVPHFDDLASLGTCLDALAAQDFADFEIVVADNGSPAGMAAVLGVIAGRATLVIAPERGAGVARNAGVAASQGAILAFTDADCVPEAGWLTAGVGAISGTADLVGGAMRVSVADEARMTPAEAFERVFAFDNRTYVERKGFSVTANLFTRRTVFDAVGGFRPDVAEDADWCLRARDAGYRIAYAPDAVVAHPARRTWPELTRKWDRLMRESAALHVARGGSMAAWLGRAWLLPLSIVAHLPKIARSAALRRPRDRLAAAAVMTRLRLWRLAAAHRLAKS